MSAERWVVDGNYNMVRDIVWQRATTLAWLNLSFPVVFWRALSRTVIRSFGRRTLFSGNKESIRQVFDGDSFPRLHRVELRNQGDADRFFASLKDT